MTAPFVHFYHSEMPGAPQLSGTAGAMLAVLDACLADGWGLVTATDLTVSGGVATATFATGPVAAVRATIEIAGATPAELNGLHRVTSVSSNTVSFDATGVADGTATGTITLKIAGSGWEKAFTGTNKRAYRATDQSATGLYLRVDDTGTTNARWRGYEAMTDVDTGTGPFPTVAQQADPGLYAPKANNTSETRKWMLVADGKRFLLMAAYYSDFPGEYAPVLFGDIQTYKAGDVYHCMVSAPSTDWSSSGSPGYQTDYLVNSGDYAGRFIARPYTQVGGSVNVITQAAGPDRAQKNSGHPSFPVGPDKINNALYACPLLVTEGNDLSAPYRGVVPGFLFVPQNLGSAYQSGSVIDGQSDMAGRELLVVKYQGSLASYHYMIDITGPWG